MYYTDTVATHICLLKQFAASKQSKAAPRKCPQCYYHLSAQDAVQTYSDGCDASPCTWSLCTGPALRFSQTGNNKTQGGDESAACGETFRGRSVPWISLSDCQTEELRALLQRGSYHDVTGERGRTRGTVRASPPRTNPQRLSWSKEREYSVY